MAESHEKTSLRQSPPSAEASERRMKTRSTSELTPNRFADGEVETENRELPITALLEGMIEGCQVIDFELRYVYLNPSALSQARRTLPELIGKRMQDCYPGIEATELFAVVGKCLRERVNCRFENDFAFPDGIKGVFDLHIVPAPQGILIFSIELTEYRRLQAQMRQSQKVIAIGQLAAGAAHDLANLITVVTGSSEMLLEHIPQEAPHRELAVVIRDTAESCADMILQILAFRRQANLRSKLTDLNRVIEDSRPMLQHLVGEKVIVNLKLQAIAGAVNIHPIQLKQVLMNLAGNARDAMQNGGELTITTSAEGNTPQVHPTKEDSVSQFARISVRDTGVGMNEETLARLFEPFFTTKVEGQGTGLGLPTVYDIAHQAGGSVSVTSAPGQGATFSIILPIFD